MEQNPSLRAESYSSGQETPSFQGAEVSYSQNSRIWL